MARTKSTRPLAGRHHRRAPAASKIPDLGDILLRLGRAQALFTVAYRSLESDDRTAARPENIALATGLAALNEVFNALDASTFRVRA